MKSEVYNIDCLEYMRQLPDKAFTLAIADPPYEIGTGNVNKNKSTYTGAGKLRGRILNQQAGKFYEWDKAPSAEFFRELRRVSENQIIWGGNYFDLPPTRCFICWDKCQPWPNFSQAEFAWTSFTLPAKMFHFDNRTGDKIHPTQKPVELYAFCLATFAPPRRADFRSNDGQSVVKDCCIQNGLRLRGVRARQRIFRQRL